MSNLRRRTWAMVRACADENEPELAMIEQEHHRLTIATNGPGFTDITDQVVDWLATSGVVDGLLTLFIRHTSASLVIQENADPDVLRDLQTALEKAARAAPAIATTPRVPMTCRRTSKPC